MTAPLPLCLLLLLLPPPLCGAAALAGARPPPPSTLVVIGGGAAGFFGAIRAASCCPDGLRVVVLEASASVLTKVKISGGGRCNVCHDDTKDDRLIASGYPRGERALLGVFSRFGATDATDWFRSRGVELKTEADGRMFPTRLVGDDHARTARRRR